MASPSNEAVVQELLDRHGRTYADEAGIDVAKGTPMPLFRLACLSLLLSARIRADAAVEAAVALADAGWTTAEHLADSTWEERVKILNENGYARYDESTARMLGDTVEHMLDRYGGDLRRLRDEAGGGSRRRAAPPEGAEGRRRRRRRHLLPGGAGGLARAGALRRRPGPGERWAPRPPRDGRGSARPRRRHGDRHVRLVAALVRAGLDDDHDDILDQAGG